MRTLSVKLVLTSAIATLLCAMPVSIGSSGSEDHPSSKCQQLAQDRHRSSCHRPAGNAGQRRRRGATEHTTRSPTWILALSRLLKHHRPALGYTFGALLLAPERQFRNDCSRAAVGRKET